jgi:hypothetical protein
MITPIFALTTVQNGVQEIRRDYELEGGTQ